MESGKDRVEAVEGSGYAGEFVNQAEALQGADTTHEVGHANSLSDSVDVAGTVANAYAHCVAAAVKAGVFQGGDDGHIVGAGELALLQQECAHGESSFVGYAAKYAAKGQQDTPIGTRHTIKVGGGRSIVVQATRMGKVLIQIEDRIGKAVIIDNIPMDRTTAGAVAFAIEQSGEVIQDQIERARSARMALELARAGA